MRDRQRALAVLLAVFLLGGIAGFGSFYLWPGLKTGANADRVGGSEKRHPRLSEELGLSKDQEASLKEIMTESRRQYEAVRKEIAPKLQEVKSQTDQKILAILNDEQKAKFEAFRRRMDKEMEARKKRGGEPKW